MATDDDAHDDNELHQDRNIDLAATFTDETLNLYYVEIRRKACDNNIIWFFLFSFFSIDKLPTTPTDGPPPPNLHLFQPRGLRLPMLP